MALLRQHDVANADAVVDVRQVLLARPVACDPDDAARVVVLRRHVVVQSPAPLWTCPRWVAPSSSSMGLRRRWPRRVVEHRQINLAVQNLADGDAGFASRACDQFLRQRLRGCVMQTFKQRHLTLLGRPETGGSRLVIFIGRATSVGLGSPEPRCGRPGYRPWTHPFRIGSGLAGVGRAASESAGCHDRILGTVSQAARCRWAPRARRLRPRPSGVPTLFWRAPRPSSTPGSWNKRRIGLRFRS